TTWTASTHQPTAAISLRVALGGDAHSRPALVDSEGSAPRLGRNALVYTDRNCTEKAGSAVHAAVHISLAVRARLTLRYGLNRPSIWYRVPGCTNRTKVICALFLAVRRVTFRQASLRLMCKSLAS